MRRSLQATAALLSGVVLTGCSFGGIQSMHLPGTVGTGSDSLHLTVELPDVTTLTPNAQVKVGDIPVGTVTSLDVSDWHAVAHISIERDVALPANAVATVGLNSILGSGFLELSAPAQPSVAKLADGAVIPLARAGAYPSTEQVLAAASVVLNGGGFAQLSSITNELNRALGGGGQAVKALLPRLTSFVTTLNSQRGQILSTIDNLDSLGRSLSKNRPVIDRALATFPQALTVLTQEREKLTSGLQAVGAFGKAATTLLDASHQNLVRVLRDLSPTFQAVAKSGRALTTALGFVLTFPFPPETATNACRGDYCNLFLTVDLSSQSLLNYLNSTAKTTGTSGGVNPLGALTHQLGGAGNPLDNLISGLLGGHGLSSGTTSPSSSPTKSGLCLLNLIGC